MDLPNQNRLRELREAAGLSRAEVATLTGHQASESVARWERGEVPMPDKVKALLASEFGVPIEHLMGWDTATAKTGVTA